MMKNRFYNRNQQTVYKVIGNYL